MSEVQIINMHNLMPMLITYESHDREEETTDQRSEIAFLDMIGEKVHWLNPNGDSHRELATEEIKKIILEKKGKAQTPEIPEAIFEKIKELRG
ncbi:MAG: hypothetical protein ACW99G_03175 [Candidatus Thorarchaeota archaeon]|jgi:hypothetical protein